LALDEPRETDERVTVDGIPFVVDEDIRSFVPPGTPIRIHFDERWQSFYVAIAGITSTC